MVIPRYVTFSLTGILHIEGITQSLTANNSYLLRFRQRPDALENIFITSTALGLWSASFKKRGVVICKLTYDNIAVSNRDPFYIAGFNRTCKKLGCKQEEVR